MTATLLVPRIIWGQDGAPARIVFDPPPRLPPARTRRALSALRGAIEAARDAMIRSDDLRLTPRERVAARRQSARAWSRAIRQIDALTNTA